MAKVASTREIIEKLETYEKIHGAGAIRHIGVLCNGDRTSEYRMYITNNLGKETVIEISSITADELFNHR